MRHLEGFKKEMLLVVRAVGKFRGYGKKEILWLCKCECGKTKKLPTSRITCGSDVSCGCYRKEMKGRYSLTHGMAKSPEWHAWLRVKARCYNKKHEKYRYYGGRGIGVATSFKNSFEKFYAEIGPRPSPKHSVERIDNSRGYAPGNIKWATMSEQRRNRRDGLRTLTIDGQTKCLTDWVASSGINYETVRFRLKEGWAVKEAVFTPSSPSNRKRALI